MNNLFLYLAIHSILTTTSCMEISKSYGFQEQIVRYT